VVGLSPWWITAVDGETRSRAREKWVSSEILQLGSLFVVDAKVVVVFLVAFESAGSRNC
jgi:hypothetical protein